MTTDVFVSVGSTFTEGQEDFVREVERLLWEHDLRPRTLGRAEWSSEQPLRAVEAIMDECDGAVVVAFERWYLQDATEQRGGDKERVVRGGSLPTVWNQIEAAMAYVKRLPLLVIVERGLIPEGLLEGRYDWYVQVLPLELQALRTPEALGRLADRQIRVEAARLDRQAAGRRRPAPDPSSITVAELLGAMRPAQIWAILAAASGLLVSAFLLGRQLAP